jgi:PAS domain S-box-containing protein
MKEINIIRRYSIVSLLAVAVFGFAFGHLLSSSMEQIMFNNEMHDMADIVNQNVVKHFKVDELIKPKKGKTYKKFSHRMDHLSLNKNIKKVKIWNRDMRIVWSENKALVAKKADEKDNAELEKALKGEIVVATSKSGEQEHMSHPNIEAERIMEIYIPIMYESQDDIQIVFETYVNLDPIYNHISHHKKMIWIWTISGFTLLYIILFSGFWSASQRIKKQTKEIIQSKQDWEETFNTITDMITIHDREFNILRANKAAEQGLGLPNLGSIDGKCHTYYHQSDEPPEWCPGLICLENGETASAEIFETKFNKHFDIRAIPRFDKDNKQIGFIHDVRDITHIKKAEEEKAKLHDQFLQVQKMDSIGRLAGGIAHDFNNILSVIIGFSEMALNQLPEKSELKDQIKTIHGAGEKAASLTKQLLAFSRKQVLEMKAVNIDHTIQDMTKMLGRLVPANITFDLDLQTEAHKILADPAQLEQILLNLVVNGRDAMPDGGLLSVKTSDVEIQETRHLDNEKVKPGSYVMLSVIDTGTGMSQDVIQKIFEPFFSTKGVGKGTGMGLSTVYGIVKQHKAHIVVNSEIGSGTSFEIYFPVAEGITEEAVKDHVEMDVRGNETVLVVDDEPLILKVVVSVLKPLGYNLLEANSGESALWVSENHQGKIDLLLTDVVMPGINGNVLAERLSKQRPETKIIFMSGYTDDAIAHHGVLDEGVVLVNKPIKGSVLAGKIREVLGTTMTAPGKQSSKELLEGMKILLADDNNDIRKLIQVYLKEFNCTIDTAENGSIAVEKFLSTDYDIVLMDMQMPVMDGLTATEEIRNAEDDSEPARIPIIALTGNTAQEEIDRCLAAGCTSHLAKPIKKDTLVNMLACTIPDAEKDSSKIDIVQEKRFIAHIAPDLKDLIPEYLEERQSDINRMQDAIQKQDYETVRMVGHTLKGSGGGFGFDPITDIGIEIEDAAIEEDCKDIEKYINELSDYLNNVEIVYE